MSNLKPLIIVLSRNYSTGLGVIRSLGAAGYDVDLIASVKKKGSSVIASSSKYVRNSKEVLTRNIQGDAGNELIEVLMEYVGTYPGNMVLFPTDDFTASVVDSNRAVLGEHFLMPHVTEKSNFSIVDLMNKTLQGEMAKAAGLLTPLEWIVSLKEEIQIPETVEYPCFVKPIESISGHKTEMAVCADQSQLKEQLFRMKKFYSNRFVLIQEYLHIDREYDLSGICLDEEVIIPGVIEKTGIARHELGVTMSGRMLSPEVVGDTLLCVKTLLKQFHYVGMFDMELHKCGDKLYFNEVNFRSGGPNFAYFLNGVNLPDILVKGFTGEDYSRKAAEITSFGKTFVYEKVAWGDYIYGYMTRSELSRCIGSADFTLLVNRDDPAPGKHFEKRIRLSALKHRLKDHGVKKDRQRTGFAGNAETNPETTPRAVIVGRNYGNILTMTRDLAMGGYQVDVLRLYKKKPSAFDILGRMKPDAYSKYVHHFRQCIVGENDGRVAEMLLGMAEFGDRPVLVPVDDYSAQIVDEYLDALAEVYLTPGISGKAGEISRLMDKNVQKKLAKEFSLPVLDSVLIKSANGKFTLPDDIVYPCFIKPNVSAKGRKSRMMKCDSREMLSHVLEDLGKTGDFEILVETYADIKAEYSLLGVSTPEGAILPGCFRAVHGGHRERKGVALTGETLYPSKLKPLIEQCSAFTASLEYTGLVDIDLIETRDGSLYFVEINFRAGASMHAFTRSGINMAAMYADYMTKKKPVTCSFSMIETGKQFISEKILLEEYVRSDISRKKAKKLMDSADIHFIKDDADPKPYRHFQRYYRLGMLLRILYRMRDCQKTNSRRKKHV